MKIILQLLCFFYLANSYANEVKEKKDILDPGKNLTYLANSLEAAKKGRYVLTRTAQTPDKVHVKIILKGEVVDPFQNNPRTLLRGNPGIRAQEHFEKEIVLDFSGANKLSDNQVETIILNLDFADNHINLIDAQINDKDRYHIEKSSPWFVDHDYEVNFTSNASKE
jgi:hypothetical protein